jgi:predicted ArsR family transcriptional regulator
VLRAARSLPSLDVLKTLGDDTRYAIYQELATAARPLATAEVAEAMGLHPNTVRPHLERMREAGLVEVRTDAPTGVGRPQHRYSLAAEAPAPEPPSYPMLAGMLVALAERTGVSGDAAAIVGREQGRRDASSYSAAPSCLEALVDRLDLLGFDPSVAGDAAGETAVIAFTHCPFRELAEAHPDLVCALHRGLVEGFVAEMGDASLGPFHTLVHRDPCQVSLVSR